jgi:membrane fusion protein, multidrug efflux system
MPHLDVSRPAVIPLLLALGLALSGCEKAPTQAREEPSPLPVRVQEVSFTPRETALTFSGSVQPRTLAEVGFRVGGKVIARPVEVGDRVRAGEVLARVDPTDAGLQLQTAESALAAATADAANARIEFARYQALGRTSPAYLPSEFDRRQAASLMAAARLAQAERQLGLARDQLAYTTLTADADGVITALPVEVGQVVAAGQTVASLAHTAQTEVEVDVPENRLPDIRDAQSVRIRLWSDPDHPLAGHVREIGARADPASRTFAVRVTVLDPPSGLLALGMTANVSFVRSAGTQVALLPATALTDRDGHPAVWVLDPKIQHAKRRPVTVAAYEGDGTVAVQSGLTAGALVVTAGADLIDPAMRLIAWTGPLR